MKNRCFFRIIMLVLSGLVLFSHAHASGTISASAIVRVTVHIRGGNLSINSTDIEFPPISLSDTIEKAVAENHLDIWDPTGSGNGWSIIASATDFISENGSDVIELERTGFTMDNITPDRILSVRGSNPPKGVGTPVMFTKKSQKILFAEKMQGMGRFSIRPSYSITIPNDVSSGYYQSDITYTILPRP